MSTCKPSTIFDAINIINTLFPQVVLPAVEQRVKAGVEELKQGADHAAQDAAPSGGHGLSSAEFDRLVADALRVYDSDKTGMQFNGTELLVPCLHLSRA